MPEESCLLASVIVVLCSCAFTQVSNKTHLTYVNGKDSFALSYDTTFVLTDWCSKLSRT